MIGKNLQLSQDLSAVSRDNRWLFPSVRYQVCSDRNEGRLLKVMMRVKLFFAQDNRRCSRI